MSAGWTDITTPIEPGMVVWPGDPGVEFGKFADMGRGDVANGSWVKMGLHSGTHIDAPLHFIADGLTVDRAPLDAMMGRARVIEIADRDSIKADELKTHDWSGVERVLFKTHNTKRRGDPRGFITDFVHISACAAAMLVERGLKTVGIDYLSVGGYERDGVETHRILLGAGVWLIENLDLANIGPSDYEMVCLPMKFTGLEAAPARVLVRPITSPPHAV